MITNHSNECVESIFHLKKLLNKVEEFICPCPPVHVSDASETGFMNLMVSIFKYFKLRVLR